MPFCQQEHQKPQDAATPGQQMCWLPSTKPADYAHRGGGPVRDLGWVQSAILWADLVQARCDVLPVPWGTVPEDAQVFDSSAAGLLHCVGYWVSGSQLVWQVSSFDCFLL